MKLMNNYIKLLAGAALLLGCREIQDVPSPSAGTADFSKYVAVGNSLTAGYADGGLYEEVQKQSYPLMIANQLREVGGGAFSQPEVQGNGSGYLRFAGLDASGLPVLEVEEADPSFLQNLSNGPNFGNMGVPGIRVVDAAVPNYADFNPFFTRMFPGESAPVSYQDVLASSDHTFFTMWMGNNDILGFAASGGVEGVGSPSDPSTGWMDQITPTSIFSGAYAALTAVMTAGDQKGLLISVPNALNSAYFTTVNATLLPLLESPAVAPLVTFDQATADQANLLYLLGGFNGANFVEGINLPMIQLGPGTSNDVRAFLPAEDLALLTFAEVQNEILVNGMGYLNSTNVTTLLTDIATVEAGGSVPTPLIIVLGLITGDDATLAGLTLQYVGARNAGADAATLDRIAGQVSLATGGQVDLNVLVPAAEAEVGTRALLAPIPTQYVLDNGGSDNYPNEIESVKTATTAFNAAIKSIADANPNLAYYDIQPLLDQVIGGYYVDGVTITGDYITGGAFSTDGIHLTPRGYAVAANGIIGAINNNFAASISPVLVNQYRGVEFP